MDVARNTEEIPERILADRSRNLRGFAGDPEDGLGSQIFSFSATAAREEHGELPRHLQAFRLGLFVPIRTGLRGPIRVEEVVQPVPRFLGQRSPEGAGQFHSPCSENAAQ